MRHYQLAGHRRILQAAKKLICAGVVVLSSQSLYANPEGGVVSAGSATINANGNTLTVNQTSHNAVIDWRSFSINPAETTHFVQPSANAAVLNRVTSANNPSYILGTLKANGQVFLINPAGIVFGANARVDVAGLVASTAHISNQNFMNRNYRFEMPRNNDGAEIAQGAIVNHGSINAAEHGLVALVAPNVENHGVIQANLGNVILASGKAFTLDLYGDQLVNFKIDTPADNTGNAVGVTNTGAILADGGKILVSAQVAKGVVDNVINMGGVAQARSVVQRGGEIVLLGGDEGVVKVSGKLDVSGKSAGQKGGKIKIAAKKIYIAAPTVIDASGDIGGGEVLIGGDYQGKNIVHGADTLANAQATVIDPNTFINADAITNGDGGRVIVWADDLTKFNGVISARGGALGGDGGFVETSGKQTLNVDFATARVDASALRGKGGEWLLDPTDFTVDDSAAAGFNTTLNAGTDVTIQTSDSGSDNGDVFFTNATTAINWTTSNQLKVLAHRNITFSTSATDRIVNSGGGKLRLIADSDGNGTGTVNFTNNSTRQVNFTNGGDVRLYYNPATNYTSPNTSYTASNMAVAGGSSQFLKAYMLINQLGSQSDNSSVKSLAAISNSTSLWNKDFALGKNIDASATATWNSNQGWSPIGAFVSGLPTHTGAFDGQNYVIDGLTLNRSSSVGALIGFFGATSGNIQNLGLTNINYTFTQSGSPGCCTEIGGLAGFFAGALSNSFTTGTINTSGSGNTQTGGLLGIARYDSSIADSYSAVNVNASASSLALAAAGLIAQVDQTTTVSRSYSSGNVSVNNTSGSVTLNYVGGLVGGFFSNNGNPVISDSYSTSKITISGSTPSSQSSGGVGGLVGVSLVDNSKSTTIQRSYSTGAVSSVYSTNVGGLIGNNTGTVTNSFWDTQTSGQSSSSGSSGAAGYKGMTTAQMMTLANFTTPANGFVTSSWDITATPSTTSVKPSNTWFIFNGGTRPILMMEYNTTVSNAHQLQLMGSTLGANYTLANNINFSNVDTNDIWGSKFSATTSGAGFVGIGGSGNFTGSLNGQSKTITNLYINLGSSTQYVGLFSSLSSATISNLSLITPNVTGGREVGALAGQQTGGTVTNVQVSGGTVTQSGAVTVGGLIGYANTSAVISNSSSTAAISSVGGPAGGLIGVLDNATVNTSYSTGAVTASGGSGGLYRGVGGLVGEIRGGIINNSYSTGAVSMSTANTYAGGLVGEYADSFTGGGLTSSINNSYSLGTVSAGTAGFAGGLVGGQGTGTSAVLSVTNSFWNTTTSGLSTSAGSSGAAGYRGMTTAQLQTQNNLTNSANGFVTGSGWDFATTPIWGLLTTDASAQGQSYPYLNALQQGIIIPTSFTGSIAVASNGANVTLAQSTTTGTTSLTYYLLLDRFGLSTTSPILVYNTGGSNFWNAIVVPGTGAASNAITFSTISADKTILIGGATNAAYGSTNYSSAITNTLLGTAASGSLSSATNNILYSVSGANLTLGSGTNVGGVTLQTSASTTYTIDGTISSAGTSNAISLAGPTTINTSSISTSGAQIYNGAVTLGATSTLASTGNAAINFASTLNGGFGLTVNTAGTTTFGGSVGGSTALTSLTTDVAGGTSIGADIRTSGAQTYNDAITLTANSILTSTGSGNINLASIVNGGFGLTVNTAGTTTFSGSVGGSTALISLTTDAAGGTSIGADIRTSGAQTYNDAVTLTANSILTSTGSGNINLASTVNGGFGLTINTAGTTTFGGAVGGSTALASLTTDAAGGTSIGADIRTSGAQTYNDAITLTANSILTSTGSGNINLASTVNGGFGLTVNTAGTTTFGGSVGGSTALTNVTTDATGGTSIGVDIRTSGAQTYNDAVTLTANSILTSTGSGDINLASTVNGGFGLTVNTAGTTTFGGAVGGSTALTSLTTNAGGTTQINGGSIRTSGAHTYNDAVTLGNSTATLTSSGGSGITFNSTLNGPQGLIIANSSGTITFGGLVGASTPLASLTIGTGNTISINTSGITTTGAQTYSSAITLGATAVLTSSSNGDINLASTVNGAFDLTINTAGTTTFSGSVGGSTALTSLTTDAAGGTSIGADIKTSGAQIYNDAIILTANSILTSTGSGNINLASTVNGAFGLTVNTAGTTIFGGNVGGSTTLTSLTTDAVGGTSIGANITTSGTQTYNDAITLGASPTLALSGSSNGAIVISNGITGSGANTLALIGDSSNNSFTLNGTLTSMGLITINGDGGTNTLLGSNSTNTWHITATNAGDINGSNVIAFSNIQNLTGGSSNDSFVFSNGQGITGIIDADGGTNALDYSAYTDAIVVNRAADAATGTGGIVSSSIQNIMGGQHASDTLVGPNSDTVWTITGTNTVSIDDGSAISDIENLQGGIAGDNTFIFQQGGTLAGTITGGSGGANSLYLSSYNVPLTVTINGTDKNVKTTTSNQTVIGQFTGIDSLQTNNQATLTTASGARTLNNTWVVQGARSATIEDPITVSGFGAINGGYITFNSSIPSSSIQITWSNAAATAGSITLGGQTFNFSNAIVDFPAGTQIATTPALTNTIVDVETGSSSSLITNNSINNNSNGDQILSGNTSQENQVQFFMQNTAIINGVMQTVVQDADSAARQDQQSAKVGGCSSDGNYLDGSTLFKAYCKVSMAAGI
jgi:filamentous hemagglutinin family protein